MVDQTAPDSGDLSQSGPTTVSWSLAALTYGVLAVILGTGAIFAIMVVLPLGYILVLGAVPYTLIATFFLLRERRAARRVLDDETAFQIETSLANFGGRAQRLSLLNGITLGLLGILLLPAVGNVSPLPDSTMFLMALVAVFSAVEIVVNAGWIYARPTILAEEYALRTRTHSWKLILANRCLGWFLWYTGAGVAGFVLVTQASDFGF